MSSARDLLLAKAVEFYAAHGVRDTSLRTLATAIGTSQRMLHYHFGSREDVLAAVIEYVVTADAELLAELFATEVDPFEAGAANWRHVRERGRIFGALFFELSSHAMLRLPHATGLVDGLTAHGENAFAAAYSTRTDPDHARRLARLTVAVGRGLLFQALVDGDFAASDAGIEDFTAMVRAELQRGRS